MKKLTKQDYINYLVDCIGYEEEELEELYNNDGLAELQDLIADESGIIEYTF